MNERFRELARRVVGKHRNDIGSISLFDQQIDQFAELIVRECVRKVEDMIDSGWYADTEELKKHFGVE